MNTSGLGSGLIALEPLTNLRLQRVRLAFGGWYGQQASRLINHDDLLVIVDNFETGIQIGFGLGEFGWLRSVVDLDFVPYIEFGVSLREGSATTTNGPIVQQFLRHAAVNFQSRLYHMQGGACRKG